MRDSYDRIHISVDLGQLMTKVIMQMKVEL